MDGNLLYVGMEGCIEAGGSLMVLVALGILTMSLVAAMGLGMWRRFAALMIVVGIAWLGVSIYSFSNTASVTGSYSDIYAIWGACSMMFAFLCFSSPLWITEKSLQPLKESPALETQKEADSKQRWWSNDKDYKNKK